MPNPSSIVPVSESCPLRPPLFVAPLPVNTETKQPIIHKLLIANRGEIARRVITTCKLLQIETVVIYVQEDENLRHVNEATEAISVGSIEDHATNPFLNIDLLIKTALNTGANAIHPGYGYLSENSQFAKACANSGIIFVGPSPEAMSTLGDKRSSKAYLQQHAPDVPLIPGFSGSSVQIDDLQNAAAEVGYPVMLKASAGGGGKGMRIVREPAQLRDELARVQSEASRSFGSSDCILGKYIEKSKHVEIQIVGDQHGHVVSFFERDCSVQRRHQKVVEESPCPFLTEEIRQEMSKTAVRITKLIGYANAGTVEFVVDVDTSRFFFLEVNARLQVEHPITEEATGVDLVALQLFVASGGNFESLPRLESLKQTGHAIECRLCAEDPQRDFFPEHGKLYLWHEADGLLGPGRDVRYETAMRSDSSISIHFDSMIAKLVVWAPTRDMAIQKMTAVLSQTACVGIKTNQLFLQRCLTHPMFRDVRYNTSFIPRNLEALLHDPVTEDRSSLRYAESIMASFFIRGLPSRGGSQPVKHPFCNVRTQFRNQRYDPVGVQCDVIRTNFAEGENKTESNMTQHPKLCLWSSSRDQKRGFQLRTITIHEPDTSSLSLSSKDDESGQGANQAARAGTDLYNQISSDLRNLSPNSAPIRELRLLSWQPIDDVPRGANSAVAVTLEITIDGSKLLAHCVVPDGQSNSLDQSQKVFCHFVHLGEYVEFRRDSLLSYIESRQATVEVQSGQAQNNIVAPMPCKVIGLLKNQGDEVKAGDPVMVIESMKMEVSIKAGKAGKFETTWNNGDAVEEGKVLCLIV